MKDVSILDIIKGYEMKNKQAFGEWLQLMPEKMFQEVHKAIHTELDESRGKEGFEALSDSGQIMIVTLLLQSLAHEKGIESGKVTVEMEEEEIYKQAQNVFLLITMETLHRDKLVTLDMKDCWLINGGKDNIHISMNEDQGQVGRIMTALGK
jgi:hypothetical protein